VGKLAIPNLFSAVQSQVLSQLQAWNPLVSLLVMKFVVKLLFQEF
jgi:hypothetical protein